MRWHITHGLTGHTFIPAILLQMLVHSSDSYRLKRSAGGHAILEYLLLLLLDRLLLPCCHLVADGWRWVRTAQAMQPRDALAVLMLAAMQLGARQVGYCGGLAKKGI